MITTVEAPSLHVLQPGEIEPLAHDDPDSIQVIGVFEGGMTYAWVGVNLINHDDVPVDEAHVEELRLSLIEEEGNGYPAGQLEAFSLAEVEGHDKYEIYNGFHRDAAQKLLGRMAVLCAIRPNTTEAELNHLRIISANTHRPTSFARTIAWATKAWSFTPWADRLTVAQAFAIGSKRKSPMTLGLTDIESKEIIDWVRDNSRRWQSTPRKLFRDLDIASMVDPELIAQVRVKTTSNQADALSVEHIDIIRRGLPGRDLEQQLVAQFVLLNHLSTAKTKTVISDISVATNIFQAKSIIEGLDARNIVATAKRSKQGDIESKYKRGDHEAEAADAIRTELLIDEIQLARQSLEIAVLRGNYIPLKPDKLINNNGGGPIRIGGMQQKVKLQTEPLPNGVLSETRRLVREHMDATHAKLAAFLTNKHFLTVEQAEEVIINITSRINGDINVGGLKFVNIEDQRQVDTLVQACLLDEVAFFKNSDGSKNIKSHGGNHINFEIGTVHYPHFRNELLPLSPLVRRALVYAAMLGLPKGAISQLHPTYTVRSITTQADEFTRSLKLAGF